MSSEQLPIDNDEFVRYTSRARELGRLHDLSKYSDSRLSMVIGIVEDDGPTGHLHSVLILDNEIDEPLFMFYMDCLQYNVFCENLAEFDSIGKQKALAELLGGVLPPPISFN